jgi:aspartyl-tRNA(Asn)/glutamyl-tRNA(Gln) amidotransferase subunit A
MNVSPKPPPNTPPNPPWFAWSALQIAAAIRGRSLSAVDVTRAQLARIEALDPALNCFTTVTGARALAQAAAVDAAVAAGRPVGPLAGVPYAVKDLFDVAGVVTLAGSSINRDLPAAVHDAQLVGRMDAAGAVLLGATTMDEYAYGFTTENAHYGPTRNPRDRLRSAGGSSGGSAAAVAAGLATLTLGSDTNGSIRVPASLCGIFGLKPTFGRLARSGSYPFVGSLDHLGPFARNVADLAVAYDVLQGLDPADPAQAARAPEPVGAVIAQGIAGLRIGVAGGYFHDNASAAARAAVRRAAETLGATRDVIIADAARARAAAYVITMVEGANLHRDDLVRRPFDFDPATRDRLLAGLLIPAHFVAQAQRFRAVFRRQVMQCFDEVDVILAPATPVAAPLLGQTLLELNGRPLPLRASLGLLTQPISFIGLPVVAVPIPAARPGDLPIGVQVIAAPWREDLALRVAQVLQDAGVAAAPVAEALAA